MTPRSAPRWRRPRTCGWTNSYTTAWRWAAAMFFTPFCSVSLYFCLNTSLFFFYFFVGCRDKIKRHSTFYAQYDLLLFSTCCWKRFYILDSDSQETSSEGTFMWGREQARCQGFISNFNKSQVILSQRLQRGEPLKVFLEETGCSSTLWLLKGKIYIYIYIYIDMKLKQNTGR